MRYLVNESADTCLSSTSGCKTILDKALLGYALCDVDSVIKKIMDGIPVDIFSILGMRNLSAFVGELFARSIAKEANGLFISNPHQDGYPDLLLMDAHGQKLYNELTSSVKLRDKAPFSPFPNGGLEIKATAAQCQHLNNAPKKALKSQIWAIRELVFYKVTTGKLITEKLITLSAFFGIFKI